MIEITCRPFRLYTVWVFMILTTDVAEIQIDFFSLYEFPT